MLCIALVIGADHAALEDAKEIFAGVGGLTVLADPLATTIDGMGDRLMRGKFLSNFVIEAGVVGMQFGFARSIGDENFAD